MFKHLRLRLTAVCAICTTFVLIAMALFSMQYPIQQMDKQAEEAFASNLNSIFFYLRDQRTIDQTWIAQTEAANSLIIHIESYGQPLLYTLQHPERQELLQELEADMGDIVFIQFQDSTKGNLQPMVTMFPFSSKGANYRAAVAAVPFDADVLMVTVLKDKTAEDLEIFKLRLVFGGTIFISVVALCIFAWFFTGWAVRPIKENQERQTQFVSSASHELRSPLTVMRASAEAIQNAPPEKSRQFAKTIAQECERLSFLTNDLLTLATADSRHLSLVKSLVEPETLLLTSGERFEPLLVQKKINLQIVLPDDALPPILCDGQRIEQVLDILINNAFTYTPEGGLIRLKVWQEKRFVCFSVEDSGPGIPRESRSHIFERFYRADKSRTQKEHYGLGLSVAKEIADLHKGSLAVGDSAEGGAAFLLKLPK